MQERETERERRMTARARTVLNANARWSNNAMLYAVCCASQTARASLRSERSRRDASASHTACLQNHHQRRRRRRRRAGLARVRDTLTQPPHTRARSICAASSSIRASNTPRAQATEQPSSTGEPDARLRPTRSTTRTLTLTHRPHACAHLSTHTNHSRADSRTRERAT